MIAHDDHGAERAGRHDRWGGGPRRGRGPAALRVGAQWWRRRFLRVALVVSVVWITFGLLFGVLADRGDGGPDRDGPPPVVFAVVAAAVAATFVAYRRLGGPVSELLGGAERIGAGEYSTRVRPGGPRAVRTLGQAFNDMAGRLEASEDARRRFLADVTHELRTPLTVLRASVEAQLDGVHARDDAHLETILDQARTLDRLVEDLRTLALGDAGRLTLHIESVSVGAIVEDAAAAIEATAARRAVSLTVDVPTEHDVELEVDPVRITQVLTNLLINAVRHSPSGGTVTLGVTASPSGVEIVVVDSGRGIAGDPERAFDRFATSADSGGSGLGLTIARQLAERHRGGSVSAANAPGGGARFTVRLSRPTR